MKQSITRSCRPDDLRAPNGTKTELSVALRLLHPHDGAISRMRIMVSDNVIPFPAPVVHLRVEPPRKVERGELLVVEHDGRPYSLAALLARLPDHVLDEIDALVPQSSQETWDLVVRRWPRLAKAAVGAL